jgi:lipopolysaccharide transport system permease protein
MSTAERPVTVITPRRGWLNFDLPELWRFRELGFYLVWRDIKVRYKQTVIGATWAILSPLVLMVVFTLVFGRTRGGGAQAVPDGVPAPIWYFAALLPWTYFTNALSLASGSVVSMSNVIKKVYFPRLILPLSGVLPGVVDFVMSFAMLIVLMLAYDVPITVGLAAVPLLVGLAGLTAFGAGLWLSAMNALYRDIREIVPFMIQILLFTSPMLLPIARVPERFRTLYALNPIVGVIEGSRWAVLQRGDFPWELVLPGLAFVAVLTMGGLIFFRRIEDVIVDVV